MYYAKYLVTFSREASTKLYEFGEVPSNCREVQIGKDRASSTPEN